MILLLAGLLVLIRQQSGSSAGTRRLEYSAPATVAAVIGVAGATVVYLPRLVQYPVGANAPLHSYNRDLFFFETLANAIARYGPAEGGLMSDWPVRSHWLTYAFAGQISGSTGLGPFIGLVRLIPVLSMITLALLAASWAARHSRTWHVPCGAVLLLLCASSIGTTPNRVINWDSPSQSLGSVWLLALVVAVISLGRSVHARSVYASTAVLALAAMGGRPATAC